MNRVGTGEGTGVETDPIVDANHVIAAIKSSIDKIINNAAADPKQEAITIGHYIDALQLDLLKAAADWQDTVVALQDANKKLALVPPSSGGTATQPNGQPLPPGTYVPVNVAIGLGIAGAVVGGLGGWFLKAQQGATPKRAPARMRTAKANPVAKRGGEGDE